MVQSHSMHSDTQETETDLIQVMCQVNKTYYGQGWQFVEYTLEHTWPVGQTSSFSSNSG